MTALPVTTNGGGKAILDEAAVREFATNLRGPVLLAGDGDYDEARKLFNGMIGSPARTDCPLLRSRRCRRGDTVRARARFADLDQGRRSRRGG